MLMLALLSGILVGCTGKPAAKEEKPAAVVEAQPAKEAGGSIFRKKTKDIGVIGKDDIEADTTITGVDPVSTSLQGYTRAISEIAKIQIKSAVDIFNATEGRYPKDYKEVKEKVIDANGIELPMLPRNLRYAYDEKSHELKIVEVPRGNE